MFVLKNITKVALFITLLYSIVNCTSDQKIFTPAVSKFIVDQYNRTLAASTDPNSFPRTIDLSGNLKGTDIYDWTSGFFAGNLWFLYELTSDIKWKEAAIKWTEALDTVQYWSGNHDVGFMMNCSYGNGLRLSGNETYKQVLVTTAESLSKRYNPVAKSIKSWNYRKAWNDSTEWFFPVIIDNMMNLELLFKASEFSGNSKFREIAVQHALTTMKNHYRSDFSCYHVVDYDTVKGVILDRATCQGLTDESSWARGQAWGLYGFITCYRFTGDSQFLSFAESIAHYILHYQKMPEDGVPYWDYMAWDTNLKPEWKYNQADYPVILRDASAAAITCSALFELSTLTEGKSSEYYPAAVKLLKILSSPVYTGVPGNKFFILNHSVGSIPHGVEIDVPLVYADYYYLEALLRYKRLRT